MKAFIIGKDNSVSYFGHFKSKADAKIYWNQEDEILEAMIKNNEVKFFTLKELQKELKGILDNKVSGSWEIARVTNIAEAIKESMGK